MKSLVLNLCQYNSIKMEYQRIRNFLDNASIQPFEFRTRIGIEINDKSEETYTSNSIKNKATMLKSNLCGFENAYYL